MAIAVLFASVNSTYAISPALQEAIPRDHLAYVASDRTGQGASDDSSTGPPPLVAIGADLLHRFGGRHVNQSAVSATLDVLSSLAKLAPYPFAVVVTDASGTFNEITRHSAWSRMEQAGAQLMTWFAVACELHRDWRNDIDGLAQLFSNHIPDYRNLITSYSTLTKR